MEHTWVKREGERCRVGVTRAFLEDAGTITFVEALPIGKKVRVGGPLALLQRAAGHEVELASPIAGKIVEQNAKVCLVDHPALVNEDPLGDGWLVVIEAAPSRRRSAR